MVITPTVGPLRFTFGPWATLLCLGLSACGDGKPDTAAWLFVTLALVAVAAASYGLGRMRGLRHLERDLRQVRADLRVWTEAGPSWAWHSDASHRLQFWRAPQAATEPAPAPVPLPDLPMHLLLTAAPGADPAAATLQGYLAAERAFSGLRLQAAPAMPPAGLPGSRCWLFSGSPRFDEEGGFAGFTGCARPIDAEEALRAAAAALGPALAACGTAAVALDDGHGWTLRHVSPQTQASWPSAAPGRPLLDWTRALPATVDASVGLIEAGRSVDVSGWRLARFDAGAGVRGLWIGQPAPQAGTGEPGPFGADPGGHANSEADQFSLTVSHDLRAPIRVVEGFTRIVKEDYGRLLDRVGNDHLDRVLGAAARMNLMIDALLTLARLSTQPLARQPVNLSQLAGYVMEDLRRNAPEREADIEIESGLSANGDPTLLRLVLDNLLGNAWKYTARCPRAHIVLRASPGASVGLSAGTEQRAFEVRDNGAGFDMRSAERLFGLFQRLHSANDFPGHGVGLASVKRIVQRHGGDIWAEAEPGRGAVFHFTLSA